MELRALLCWASLAAALEVTKSRCEASPRQRPRTRNPSVLASRMSSSEDS